MLSSKKSVVFVFVVLKFAVSAVFAAALHVIWQLHIMHSSTELAYAGVVH